MYTLSDDHQFMKTDCMESVIRTSGGWALTVRHSSTVEEAQWIVNVLLHEDV